MNERLRIKQTTVFKKDLKRLIKQGRDMAKLGAVVDRLAAGEALDPFHRDHALSNNWRGFRDCHVEPDWVLIYRVEGETLVLALARTGSYSGLGL